MRLSDDEASAVERGPERIWATVNGASTRVPDGARQLIGGWSEDSERPRSIEYVRADIHAALVSELMEAREAQRGRPFETAPETGTFFVFRETSSRRDGPPYNAGNSQFAVMTRHPHTTILDSHFGFDMDEPTHWMPLPDARNFLKDKETDNAGE